MEAARRALLADVEARQMRAGELAVVESSSWTVEKAGVIADSAVDAENTTEGVQITEVMGSEEPDPPACWSSALCAPGLLHLPLYYFKFMHWGQLHVFLLGVVLMESEC